MAVGAVWSEPVSAEFPDLQGKYRENLRFSAVVCRQRFKEPQKPHGYGVKSLNQVTGNLVALVGNFLRQSGNQ